MTEKEKHECLKKYSARYGANRIAKFAIYAHGDKRHWLHNRLREYSDMAHSCIEATGVIWPQ